MLKGWFAVVAGWTMLAGCTLPNVTSEPHSEMSARGAVQHAAPAGPDTVQPMAPVVSVGAPPHLENPVTVVFEERSTELDASQRELIAQIAAQASQSSQIVLTGLADRSAITNAREIAVARAVAVREALRQAGIKTKRFRIKYGTAQARHGVIVQWTQ